MGGTLELLGNTRTHAEAAKVTVRGWLVGNWGYNSRKRSSLVQKQLHLFYTIVPHLTFLVRNLFLICNWNNYWEVTWFQSHHPYQKPHEYLSIASNFLLNSSAGFQFWSILWCQWYPIFPYTLPFHHLITHFYLLPTFSSFLCYYGITR